MGLAPAQGREASGGGLAWPEGGWGWACVRGSQTPCFPGPRLPALPPQASHDQGSPAWLGRDLLRPRCAGSGHSSDHVPPGGGAVGWQSLQRVKSLTLGRREGRGQETLPRAASRAVWAGLGPPGQHRGSLEWRLRTGFVCSPFSFWSGNGALSSGWS